MDDLLFDWPLLDYNLVAVVDKAVVWKYHPFFVDYHSVDTNCHSCVAVGVVASFDSLLGQWVSVAVVVVVAAGLSHVAVDRVS